MGILGTVSSLLGNSSNSSNGSSREGREIEKVGELEEEIETEEDRAEAAENQGDVGQAEKILEVIERHLAEAETDLDQILEMEEEDLKNMLKLIVNVESKDKEQQELISKCLEEFNQAEDLESQLEQIVQEVEGKRDRVYQAQLNYLVNSTRANRPDVNTYEEIFAYIDSNIDKVSVEPKNTRSLYEIVENKIGDKQGPLYEGLKSPQGFSNEDLTASEEDLKDLGMVFSRVAHADGYKGAPVEMTYEEQDEIGNDLKQLFRIFEDIASKTEKVSSREDKVWRLMNETHDEVPDRLNEIKAMLEEMEELHQELERLDVDISNLEEIASEEPGLENRERKLMKNFSQLRKQTGGNFEGWIERTKKKYVKEEEVKEEDIKELKQLVGESGQILENVSTLKRHTGSREIDLSGAVSEAEEKIEGMYKMTDSINKMAERVLERKKNEEEIISEDKRHFSGVERKIQPLLN